MNEFDKRMRARAGAEDCPIPAGFDGRLEGLLHESSPTVDAGRSSMGTSPVTSTMVDSTPMPTGPPSRIISIFPLMSSHTWSAVVGLGRPEVLALGAATGTPARAIRRLATGSLGIRTATVSKPPVVP